MIRVRGQEWGTAQQIAQALGPDITPDMVRNWWRRDGLPACRIGRSVYYPLARAAQIERQKRQSTRGRPRQVDVATLLAA